MQLPRSLLADLQTRLMNSIPIRPHLFGPGLTAKNEIIEAQLRLTALHEAIQR
jgi:hypothetical protein